jgi:hypothetical protein
MDAPQIAGIHIVDLKKENYAQYRLGTVTSKTEQ